MMFTESLYLMSTIKCLTCVGSIGITTENLSEGISFSDGFSAQLRKDRALVINNV